MRYSLLIFILTITTVFSQNKKSKGDGYFFEYAYQKAITAYESDKDKGILLTPGQYLNLADSYFQIENYEKATDMYSQYFSNDSVVDNFRLNRYLHGLTKIGNDKRIDDVLQKRETATDKEFLENIAFNRTILGSDSETVALDFKIFNLDINSPQADFSPTFYKSNLLFSSSRPNGKKTSYGPTGESYLDIFNGQINAEGQLTGIKPFGNIKASDYHKATPYFSEALNSVFYVLSNTTEGKLEFDENGKNALAIGVQKIDGDFRFLWRDLSTSFYYPFYDSETERLYFAANFENGYGGTDIYYVNTNRGSIMSAPINLGPRVNSPGNEIAPFIFENGMYFSSDVFYGLGGMDIYQTKIDVNGDFSIPVNLGESINSAEDDFGFVMRDAGSGLLGYFSSNRKGGKGSDDVYGFMVDEKPGIKTLVVKGKVVNKNQSTVLTGAKVTLKDSDKSVLKEVLTADDGTYRIEVPWQEEATLEVTKEKHSLFKQNYGGEALDELKDLEANVGLVAYEDIVEDREGQKVIKLRQFYFSRNKATITPEIAIELDKVVEAIKLFPEIQLRIETHTDSRGGSATNFRLTQLRSDAIKKYLIDMGVSNSNILYSVGYGEDKILNNCKNGVYCIEVLHKKNQRSLFVVLNDNLLFK